MGIGMDPGFPQAKFNVRRVPIREGRLDELLKTGCWLSVFLRHGGLVSLQ